MMPQNRCPKFILLALLFFNPLVPVFASMNLYDLYPRPTNDELYQQADIIAIVKTLSGMITRTGADEGSEETKVVSKVLNPIKGTQQGAELEIYLKRAEINAEYVAILRWDENVKGYRFLSHEMDYSVVRVSRADFIPVTEGLSVERVDRIKAMNKIILSGIEKLKTMLGFQGEIVFHDGWLYLPNCKVFLPPEDCQRNFEQVQFMLKKLQEQKKPQ